MAMDDVGRVMQRRRQADKHSSEFEKQIFDTLNPSSDEEGKIPIMRWMRHLRLFPVCYTAQ